MDSDLSLLEISGEDDSLLQQIPNDDISNVSKYLSCSPLQFLKSAAPSRSSPLDYMKADVHIVKPSRSSPRYTFNKENVNASNSDVSKLGKEPQQMKRRKKGGGYNLRKSLAWNRAFFTEEGVLDPSELSLISGTFNTSNGEALSAIQEEGGNSLVSDSESISDSADLQVLEEHLLKELPASTLNEGKMIGGCFLPKCGSSAQDNVALVSAATRKVLSARYINRSGSKRGGYSRPLASSSQKRPANASTMKAVMKGSNIPKIPASRPDPISLPATTRRATLSASRSNNNQIAKRAHNVQKNVGLKGLSNSRRIVEPNVKDGPNSKVLSSNPSAQPFRKDMVYSPKQMPSSSNLRSPLVTKLSSGIGLVPDPSRPATATQDAQDISSKYAIPLPPNAKNIGGNMLSTQVKKPSSLRMPSPSLGFFGQQKASGSQSLVERGTPQCNIPKIPGLQKLGATNSSFGLRPPRAPRKTLQAVNDDTVVRRLSSASSVPSGDKSTIEDNINLNLQKGQKKVPQRQLHNTRHDAVTQCQEHAEPSTIEKFFGQGDRELQINDNKSQSRSNEHLEKTIDHMEVPDVCAGSRDSSGNEMEKPQFESQFGPAVQLKCVSQTNLMTEHQQVEGNKYNSSIENLDAIAESPSGNVARYSYQGGHHDGLNCTYDIVEQSKKQDELTKFCFGKADQIFYEENQGTQTNDSILFQEKSRSVSLKVRGVSGSKFENSNGSPEQKEQANEAAGIDIMAIKSHVIDAQLQFSDCSPLVGSYSRKLSTAVDNQCLMVTGVNEHLGEQSDQSPRLVEQVSHSSHGLRLNEFCGSKLKNVLFMSRVSPAVQVAGDSGTKNLIEQLQREDHKYHSSGNNHGVISESQSGDDICSSDQETLITPSDCASDMPDVEKQYVDQSELAKTQTCGTDQISHKEIQKLQASEGILIDEHCKMQDVLTKSCSGKADRISYEENQGPQTDDIILFQESRSVSLKVQGVSGSKLESSNGSPVQKEQANEVAGVDIMTIKSNAMDAQLQFSDSNLLVGTYSRELSTSVVDNQRLMDADVNEHLGEQSELQSPRLVQQVSQDCHEHLGEQSELQSPRLVQQVSQECHEHLGEQSELQSPRLVQQVSQDCHEHLGEQSELQSPRLVQQIFQDCHGLRLNDFCGSKLKNVHFMSRMSPVQVAGDSGTKTLIEQIRSENHKYHISGNIHGVISEPQAGDDISSSDQSTLMMPSDCASDMPDVEKQSADLSELASQGIADVSPRSRGSNERESDSSQPSSQSKCINLANNEGGEMYNITEKSDVGDVKVQSLDGNQFVEDGNSKISNSVDHDDYPMLVDDDVYKQLGKHSKLESPFFSSEDSQEENIHVCENVEFVVSKCSDASGSESKGSGVLSFIPPSAQTAGVANVEQMGGFSHVENVLRSCIETEPLAEDQAHITETQLRCDFDDQATITAGDPQKFNYLSGESEISVQTLPGKAESKNSSNNPHNNGSLFEETRLLEEFQNNGTECTADVSLNVRGSSGSELESLHGSAQLKYTEEASECTSEVGDIANNSQVEDTKEVPFLDRNLISETCQYNQNISLVHNQFRVVGDDAKEVSVEHSNQSTKTFCSPSEESCLSGHNDHTPLNQSITEGLEISGMKENNLLEEVEPQNSNSSNIELREKVDNAMSSSEDMDATMQLKKSGNDLKLDVPVIKPPPNAVPFSEEWLAAIEAAGEDILTMKTGAVQNSPTDKSTVEPGPWSPVRRKNNQGIGPFDCTKKYTNISPSNSH